MKACSVVGKGLYGVDIKEVNGDYVVVEVNDNPSIYAGYEDSSTTTFTSESSATYQNSPIVFDTYLF